MKIKVAIVGYGNLGKAVEKVLLTKNNVELVCIFSKRENITSAFGTPIFLRDQIENYKEKIDLLVLCSGSQNQMLEDAPELAEKFNIINTFDTHALLAQEFEKIDAIATKSNHMAIIACGWDPGLLSNIRAMFFAVENVAPITLWGPGMSLGHSDAVRKITNVNDAIAITIPAKNGQNAENLHRRLVYVVCEKHNRQQIKNQILSMPNYFAGQNVKVKFVSQSRLNKLKNYGHAGRIICRGSDYLEFWCKMQSNPTFTAKIVASYVCVFDYLKRKYGSGAFVPLDFSPADLIDMDRISAIKKFC